MKPERDREWCHRTRALDQRDGIKHDETACACMHVEDHGEQRIGVSVSASIVLPRVTALSR